MNWEAFWDAKAQVGDKQAQVGRVGTGSQAGIEKRIAEHIATRLDLQATDRLLDVCCGNGDLTALLAPRCAQTLGVDLSAQLIDLAKTTHAAEGLHFVRADARQLSGLNGPFTKMNLYFSFQYFEHFETGLRVLAEMDSLLTPGGKIFIGDTPDARRWFAYYNQPIKWLRYGYQKWKGKEPMGKFWHPNEFKKIAKSLGLQVEILPEPADLPYAWYRFDAVFTKKLA